MRFRAKERHNKSARTAGKLWEISRLFIIACLALASCQQRPPVPDQRFELRGKVVSVDKSQSQVVLAHEEIRGYMPAMTMPFAVKDAWAMSILSPGQVVEAALVVRRDRSWLEEIRITQTSGGDAPRGRAGDVQEPKPGDKIPDFELTNQDGRRIHLSQYRGSVLLLTFVYTRCPLPDYCPRMSGNFAEIYRAIKENRLQKIHLLTISFDPEYDSPKVLHIYGEAYAGSTEAFSQWEFASGTAEEVKQVATYFGLTYRQETGQIIHSLRTALISADGRLEKLYRGNDWTPQQVLTDLKRLTGP